jgi:lysophospholipase L1-like esterase
MAAEENTIVADVHAAMMAAGPLPDQFTDHVHPNDEGYRVIAQAFFEALTNSSLRTTSAPTFGFVGPETSTD